MFHRLTARLAGWRRRWPPRNGPMTLFFAVFRPYVVAPLLFLVFAQFARSRSLRVALVPLLLLATLRWRRKPAPSIADMPSWSVMSWNILFGNPDMDGIARFLAAAPAPVVAVQELTAAHIERIDHDAAIRRRFPHRVLWTSGYGAGMGLLSEYPIMEHGQLQKPPALWARIALDMEREFVIVSAHPTFFQPRTGKDPPPPARTLRERFRRVFDERFLRYNTDYRDDGIRRVREVIDRFDSSTPLLVVGDFNVTERERAYRDLSAGLTDVFRVAGHGNGMTWRPEWLASTRRAVLRIDYMLCNDHIHPLRMTVDHTPRGSDHSPILGTFTLAVDREQRPVSEPSAACQASISP